MNGTTDLRSHKSERFFNLVGDLQEDVKRLVTKEINLAKAEMGEKFSALGKNAGLAAAGGILALIAVFMLLLGIGAIVANLLQRAGLSPGAAYFLAYMGLSLVLGGIGYFLIRKALTAFSQMSLSPDKTIAGARAAEPVPIKIRNAIATQEKELKEQKSNSNQLQSEVIAARARMDDEMSELKSRLTPGYMIRSFFSGIKHHPTRVLLVGASTGLGGYLVWRNRHMMELRKTRAERKWWQFRTRHA
jgi:hypothetical protein